MLSCGMDANGVWTAALRRPDGTQAWVLWSAGKSQMFPLPPSWNVRQSHDLTGKVTALGSQKNGLCESGAASVDFVLKAPVILKLRKDNIEEPPGKIGSKCLAAKPLRFGIDGRGSPAGNAGNVRAGTVAGESSRER
jgi:hypothetical protein